MKALRIGLLTAIVAAVGASSYAQIDYYAGSGTLSTSDNWNSSASGLKWATSGATTTWTAAATGNNYHLNGYSVRTGRTGTVAPAAPTTNQFAGQILYIDPYTATSNQASTTNPPTLIVELAATNVGPKTNLAGVTWGTYVGNITVSPSARPLVPAVATATGLSTIQANSGATVLDGTLTLNGDTFLKLPSAGTDLLFAITATVTGTGRIEAAGGNAGGGMTNGVATWQFSKISGDNATLGSGWQGASINVLNKHTLGFATDTDFYRTNPNAALYFSTSSAGYLNLANSANLSVGSGKFVLGTYPTLTVLPDGVYTVSLLNKIVAGLAGEGTYVTGSIGSYTANTPNITGTTSKVYVGSAIGASNPNAVPAIASTPFVAVSTSAATNFQVVATNSPTSYAATNLPAGLAIDPTTGIISGTATTTGTSTAVVMATNANGTGRSNLTFTVGLPLVTAQPLVVTPVNVAMSQLTLTGSNTSSSTTWTAAPLPAGLTLSTATGSSGKVTGTPTTVGTTDVVVTATNGGLTGTATVRIIVTGTGQAPTVLNTSSIAGKVGSPLYYQIEATNTPMLQDGTGYAAAPLPDGMSVNAYTGLISGTPTTPGVTTVTLTATNGTGSGTGTLTIAVGTPAITSSTDPVTAINGQSFSYQITGSNNATSFTAYPLPAGLSIDPSTGLIAGTPTANGTMTVTLSAANAASAGTATLALTVRDAGPGITSAATASGIVGTAFSYQVTTARTATSYAATPLPAGLSIDTTTGAITGTPTTPGTTSVQLSATNAEGTTTQTLALTIDDATPVVTSETKTATATAAYSYQIAATGHPTSYAAAPLPDGLSINTTTGVISGIPTTVGSTTVNVSATNVSGTGTGTVTINVIEPLPVMTSNATASGIVGTAFSYQIAATGHPTSFAATPLPAGLTLDTSTGIISGTPTTAGTTTVDVSETNTTGTGTASLVITIYHQIPVITSGGTATGAVGTAFSYQIAGTGVPTSFTATPLPAGLSVNASTGVISGVPVGTGITTVTITATNETGTGSGSVEITIQNAAPSITSATSAFGSVGAPFNYQITASGSPTSFGATSLPAGLSVDTTTGLISGTPTAAGVSTVTLSATNANGTGTATLTLTIDNVIATHAVAGPGYAPGQAVTVTNTFSYAGTATNLHWSVTLPAGWSYVGSAGSVFTTEPTVGQIGTLDWTWSSPPASPITFTYTVNVPANATGAQQIAASVSLTLDGAPVTVPGLPDPLTLDRVQFHSADSNQDGAIGLLELSRVVELYNTHNGPTRTGGYSVLPGSEDGFTPDTTRTLNQPVTLTAYHSADENKDGQISLSELTRVIELYNTHTGPSRTGQYHVQIGTEDGFATGQ